MTPKSRLTFCPPCSPVFPLLFLCVLYLPTCITVLVWSIRHSHKEMQISEKAVLFVLPIFTNLYFIKPVKKDNSDPGLGVLEQDVILRKSNSLPNLHRKHSLPVLKARSNSLRNLSTSVKESSETQSEFSIFHSNVLYFVFFLGAFIILGSDLTIQLARHYKDTISYTDLFIKISNITKIFIGIFFVNLILWLDFNYSIFKKKQPSHQSENRWKHYWQLESSAPLREASF